ncbi:MAG: hypothetical protein K0R57_5273 [Paenibacillaceae bacterium]|nr:hypothetical protein [Paenibacillaceae bacterium]
MTWMEVWTEFWKSCVVILSAMVLLRIAGRKSISQMTIPTTVIMISIGTVIVQPIAEKSIWAALVAAVTFILILLLMEYLEVKWNWFENVMRGRAITIIRDGKLEVKELAKLRMTVDQLEMKLRQTGIARMEDLKTVTMETNGLIGYEYMPDAQPVTYGQMKSLLAQFAAGSAGGASGEAVPALPGTDPNLFAELNIGEEHHPDKQLN